MARPFLSESERHVRAQGRSQVGCIGVRYSVHGNEWITALRAPTLLSKLLWKWLCLLDVINRINDKLGKMSAYFVLQWKPARLQETQRLYGCWRRWTFRTIAASKIKGLWTQAKSGFNRVDRCVTNAKKSMGGLFGWKTVLKCQLKGT